MKKRIVRPPKVEFEFTDLDLTAFGGASVLARTARRFGLFELLDEAVSVKVRNRGASDTEILWAVVASLARGHGALSDLDALRADTMASTLLGLGNVPEARRAGEWLGRMSAGDVKRLWHAAVEFATQADVRESSVSTDLYDFIRAVRWHRAPVHHARPIYSPCVSAPTVLRPRLEGIRDASRIEGRKHAPSRY